MDVSELKVIDGPRGPVVAVEIQTGGESTVELLQAGIENAVLKMDFERTMRWGNGSVSWARPIHNWSCCSERNTFPARLVLFILERWTLGIGLFATPFDVTSVSQWVSTLEERRILVDRDHRRKICTEQLVMDQGSISRDQRLGSSR